MSIQFINAEHNDLENPEENFPFDIDFDVDPRDEVGIEEPAEKWKKVSGVVRRLSKLYQKHFDAPFVIDVPFPDRAKIIELRHIYEMYKYVGEAFEEAECIDQRDNLEEKFKWIRDYQGGEHCGRIFSDVNHSFLWTIYDTREGDVEQPLASGALVYHSDDGYWEIHG